MHVALLTVPATGHVHPTLDLAAELVRRGHRVTYLVPAEFGWAAARTGAEHQAYGSTIEPAPRRQPPPAEFACWLPFILLQEAQHVLPQLEPLLSGLAPDVLVYDRTAYLVAHVLSERLGCPAVELFPSFAYNEHFDLVGELERATVLDPAHEAHRKLVRGFTELGESWGVSPVDVDDFVLARADRAVVAVPREFQVAGDTFPGGYTFVGPGLRTRGGVRRGRPDRGTGLVFASLGTAFTDRASTFASIRTALEAMGRRGLMVVGSLPPGVAPSSGSGVEVRPRVDQLDALRRADVFVTHAGMGSVQEAAASGVPMVCLPWTTEQQAVARRVADLGLGVVLRPEASAEQIAAAIGDVGADARICQASEHWAESLRDVDAGSLGADAVEAALSPPSGQAGVARDDRRLHAGHHAELGQHP